jgi:hypothetical protein
VPSATFLESVAAPAAAALPDEAPAEPAAAASDGSLGIGSLRKATD